MFHGSQNLCFSDKYLLLLYAYLLTAYSLYAFLKKLYCFLLFSSTIILIDMYIEILLPCAVSFERTPHAYKERESFVFFSLLDPIYGVYNVLLRVTKVVETLENALREKSH